MGMFWSSGRPLAGGHACLHDLRLTNEPTHGPLSHQAPLRTIKGIWGHLSD
jgi:hypothetical protein